jgi:hypothetical protein
VPNPTTTLSPSSRIARVATPILDSATRTTVDSKVAGVMSEIGKAKLAIDRKHAELHGAPGQPLGGVEFGAGNGYFRRFQNGVIYLLPPSGPCWVHGAILDEYLALDAERGFLGYPTTDERATPDATGRYNHFERGSIYWSYQTGAHEVHGAIRDKWASLGWEKSRLGFPLSGEREFTEGGRYSRFERGFIYWWPDVGAFDLGPVTLRYKGLYCFGETDFDAFSDSDEPFVLFGILPTPEVPGSVEGAAAVSQIYSDVDAGDERPDDLELYRGAPHSLGIGITLVQNGSDNPGAYLPLIKQGVDLAGKGIAAGCGSLFGPEAATTCESMWGSVAPAIAAALSDVVDPGDLSIGDASLSITAKEMVLAAHQGDKLRFWGIEYHRESPLISGRGASYKVYFSVERA